MASKIYRMGSPRMTTIFGRYLLVTGRQAASKQELYLSTSCSSMIKWRYDQDVEPNPNRFGFLTNKPDYSFVDGRPVPLSKSSMAKLELQESYCKRIIQLCNELDFAIERHKQMDEETKEKQRRLIESKLKEKGNKDIGIGGRKKSQFKW